MSLDDARVALANTYKILAPEGVFRCVVPDLEKVAKEYLSSIGRESAHRFQNYASNNAQKRRHGLLFLAQTLWGNGTTLSVWDYPTLEAELLSVGFRNVRRVSFGDADDPAFKAVEERYRWDGAVGIEGIR
jgi:predicted SAM-dependent methyltransferase